MLQLEDRKRQLAGLLKLAAEGQQDVAEVSVALKIVLSLEGVPLSVERRRFPARWNIEEATRPIEGCCQDVEIAARCG